MSKYLVLASEYVTKKYGSTFAVASESIQDLDDLYCFISQTKEFLKTGDISKAAIGNGYIFIYKRDKRFFEIGSRFTFEQALRDLRDKLIREEHIKKHIPNFQFDLTFDLKIVKVHNQTLLLDVLAKYEIMYTIPEVVANSIFRIPKRYTKALLQTRLKELPVVFHGVSNSVCLFLIGELLQYNVCQFELQEHQARSFAKYVERSSSEDMETIW